MSNQFATPSQATAHPAGALRLTRRGRFVLFAFALLVVMGSMFFASSAVASDSDPGIEVATVTVASGETLWHHAKSVAAPGEDLRDIVDVIKDLNNLPNSELQAGQQLLLPAARN